MQMKVDDIKLTKRIREDLGKIDVLANSIKANGLIQPVIIDKDKRLIAGLRRLTAAKKLELDKISVSISEIKDPVVAEIEENNSENRKDFTWAEKLKAEEELKKRLKNVIKRGNPGKNKNEAENEIPQILRNTLNIEKGEESRQIVANNLGVSHTSLKKAHIVAAATTKYPEFKGLLNRIDNGKTSLDKAYKQVLKHERLQEFLQSPVTTVADGSINLIHGDMQIEFEQVKDNFIDLIFTDPPYDEEHLYLYGSLLFHADRVLKTGGSLVTYAGHYAIPQIIHYYNFTRNLEYYWIFAVIHSGPFSSFFAKNILVEWKPLLWFVKVEQEENKTKAKPRIQNGKIFDLIYSTRPNKIVHDHEQSSDDARYIIEQLTKPGDTVFDPFMGSWSTGIAALNLKRQFVGIEIDAERFEIAKTRISNENRQKTQIDENKTAAFSFQGSQGLDKKVVDASDGDS